MDKVSSYLRWLAVFPAKAELLIVLVIVLLLEVLGRT